MTAGNVDHGRLVELVGVAFDGLWESGAGLRPQGLEYSKPRPAAPILLEQRRASSNKRIWWSAPWPHALSNDRYAASLRVDDWWWYFESGLWQKVQEERGSRIQLGLREVRFRMSAFSVSTRARLLSISMRF